MWWFERVGQVEGADCRLRSWLVRQAGQAPAPDNVAVGQPTMSNISAVFAAIQRALIVEALTRVVAA